MDTQIERKADDEHSDAWNKGYSAAGFGADRSACHFGAGTEDAADWHEGFSQWHTDSQPKKDA